MALTTGFKRLLTLTVIIAVVGGGTWYADKNNFWGALDKKAESSQGSNGLDRNSSNSAANRQQEALARQRAVDQANEDVRRAAVQTQPEPILPSRNEVPAASEYGSKQSSDGNRSEPGTKADPATTNKLKALKGL